MQYLVILNDPPDGTERSYNGLRLALVRSDYAAVTAFLMGDAAGCALAGQATPHGHYNLERMVKELAGRGARIGVCSPCMDTRGIKAKGLIDGARLSSMDELAGWTQAADKVAVL